MVRFIPDTNQVGKLRGWDKRPTVALPPCVLAELLLYSKFPSQHTLRSGELVLGLEPVHVFDEVARLDLEEVSSFEPFLSPSTKEEAAYLVLVRALQAPEDSHLEWARDSKAGNLAYCEKMGELSQGVRRKMRDMFPSRGEGRFRKFQSMEEVVERLCLGEDSLMFSLIEDSLLFEGSPMKSRYDLNQVVQAALSNPYLSRYFHTIVCFLVSVSRFWHHNKQGLNLNLSAQIDDWTDVTLSLYASPGDVVLSEDTWVRSVFDIVNPSGEIRVLSAEQAYAEYGVA